MRPKFPNIVVIQNNYNHFVDDYLMFDLNKEIFLNENDNKPLNISRKDLSYIIRYIIKNKKYFSGLSTGTMYWKEFMDGCRNNNKNINESIYSLNEVVNLLPSETGLSIRIWVDTNQTYKKENMVNE